MRIGVLGSGLMVESSERSSSARAFGLLVARLAYEGSGGPAIAHRFDELEERSRLSANQ
jgi:hypothetical protein